MDQHKRKLGRGLSSLLNKPVEVHSHASQSESTPTPHSPPHHKPDDSSTDHTSPLQPAFLHIPLDRIIPSPFQPRRHFDPAQLAQLADSIRTAGVMQPLLVRPAPNTPHAYELVAGERRWRSAQLAGLATVPAIVTPLDDEESAEWAIIENLQRVDLGPMERAQALANLAERFALTHAQIADKVGLDRTTITNTIRLIELEPAIQDMMESRRLTTGHGRALLAVPPGPARITLAERAAGAGWSVRRLEKEARLIRDTAPSSLTPTPASPTIAQAASNIARQDLESQLSAHLGTRVRIHTKPGASRGYLSIDYYDLDHFDDLITRLGLRLG